MDKTEKMSAEAFQKSLRVKPAKPAKRATPTLPALRLGSGSKAGITEFIFQGLVPGMNGRGGLIRMSHRRKKTLRDRYQLMVMAHSWATHDGPVRVELIRHSIGGKMDYPNLVSTEKLLLDAIVRAGVLPDDKDAIIQERTFEQTRALNKYSQFTLIRIIDL